MPAGMILPVYAYAIAVRSYAWAVSLAAIAIPNTQ
jgi:hypothetical protein